MIFPFWRFIAPKRKLAPNIIDKQIFEFLISGCADIRLINERQRSKNTDIWVRLEKMWKIWYPVRISKFLYQKCYILIRRISPKKWYPPNTGCYLPSRHQALLRPCPVATYQVGTTLFFFSSCPKVPLSLALHDDHHGHAYCASLQLPHRLSSSSCLPWCRKPRKLLGVVCRRMYCQAWLL